MNQKALDNAEKEAKRFLQKIKELKEREDPFVWIVGNKQSGAVRRASMDLTRALAELRK